MPGPWHSLHQERQVPQLNAVCSANPTQGGFLNQRLEIPWEEHCDESVEIDEGPEAQLPSPKNRSETRCNFLKQFIPRVSMKYRLGREERAEYIYPHE